MIQPLTYIIIILVFALYIININELISLTTQDSRLNLSSYILLVPYFIAVYLNYVVDWPYVPGICLTGAIYIMPVVIIALSNKNIIPRVIYISFLYLFIDSLMSEFGIILSFFTTISFNEQFIVKTSSLIFGIISWHIIKHMRKTRTEEIRMCISFITKKIYVFLFAAVFSIGELGALIALRARPNDKINLFIDFLFVFSSIMELIIMVGLLFNCISKFQYKNTAKLMENQLNTQLEYYKKMEAVHKSIYVFQHDYKNHMICLNSLLDQNYIDEAIKYINDITDHTIITLKLYTTGNYIADSILDDKNELARKYNCHITFRGVISPDIQPIHMCTILSNALDNAIEACMDNDTNDDQEISVYASLNNGFQMLKITNPSYNHKAKKSNLKQSVLIHGIGLNNVRNTVNWLDGNMEISDSNSSFTLDILFRASSGPQI